jgi:subtilisin family serine protease
VLEMRKIVAAGVSLYALIAAAPAMAAPYAPGYSAGWWSQIGLTTAIETTAAGGKGITIALIDTGVVSNNAEIAGRVSTASSCAAVTFACSNGVYDDNGHGTATAAIAAGATGPYSPYAMSGVAPAATILSEKVLGAAGSGTDLDVANGIIKAANGGALVISLSLTYIPSTSVINAINYATAKGAVIVFAGGNSSQALNGGANTVGLTATSLSHLIFVGSVNSSNTLSSFSNTPGAGKAGTSSYASLWLMAPGESIVAPGVQYGATSFAYWTGTSMSAPEVAGAVALLDATWPVLVRNGTTTQVLFRTATDLGTSGVDSTYGNGLLNLTKAFQPIGALTVTQANGQSVPITSLSYTTVTGGALGSLASVKTALANYTSFDTFQRNFLVNLSGLLATKTATGATAIGAITAPVASGTVHLMSGGELTVAASDMDFAQTQAARVDAFRLAERTIGPRDPSMLYVAFTSPRGDTVAAGRGVSSTLSFASALWGPSSAVAFQSNQLGVSNGLTGMAQGGYFASGGVSLPGDARLALTMTASPNAQAWNGAPDRGLPQASAMAAGLSARVTARWTAGLTISALDQRNGLLGTTYDGRGLINLGDSHHSTGFGFATAYDLGGRRSVMIDAMVSRSSASSQSSGLVSGVSAVTARAYGVSLVQASAWREGDLLSLSLRKPLRVTAGMASLATTSVDADGYPTTAVTPVSLKPNGDETDLSLAYAAPVRGGFKFNAGIDYRDQAENVKGLSDVVVRFALGRRF